MYPPWFRNFVWFPSQGCYLMHQADWDTFLIPFQRRVPHTSVWKLSWLLAGTGLSRTSWCPGLSLHLQDFPSKLPLTALCSWAGLPWEGMWGRVWLTSRLQLVSWAPRLNWFPCFGHWGFIYSGYFFLIGASFKIIPFLSLTYLWFHYFPNRIPKCKN